MNRAGLYVKSITDTKTRKTKRKPIKWLLI